MSRPTFDDDAELDAIAATVRPVVDAGQARALALKIVGLLLSTKGPPMPLPSIAAITAAARTATQTRPRPGADFFREALRALVRHAPRAATEAVAYDHKWIGLNANDGDGTREIVELAIIADPFSASARRRWSEVYGLTSEDPTP